MTYSIPAKTTIAILAEMCRMVGIEEIDTSKPNWFLLHSWTREEENTCAEWIAGLLKKDKVSKHPKGYLYLAQKILADIGWRLKR